jgi:isoaspartyl peptidase/L-asparaginase-like protein (Ntn-hydrolase superfamily)
MACTEAKQKLLPMPDRRKFIKLSLLSALAASLSGKFVQAVHLPKSFTPDDDQGSLPLVVSTWSHGIEANEAAMEQLLDGTSALDAVEKGVNVPEADPEVNSVGFGGLPDAEGNVTLDACIMGPDGNAGSVSYLQHIMHPVSVARLVMEKTPHLMLSGEGALKFALDQGFVMQDLLSEEARQAWEEWKASGARYAPKANWENHDTIGMLAIDSNGDIAGACTTSGMSFKHPGRVGDSPIIGAGLFVDNNVGAATATGEGEAIMKTLGSFLVVELMRNGMSPDEACRAAVQRSVESSVMHPQLQIGYIAVNKKGSVGAFAMRPGFQYALFRDGKNILVDVPYLIDWE